MKAATPARTAPERETLNVEEAGRILGLGRDAAYRAARTGQLPVLRIGRRLLVSRTALRRMLDQVPV
jgi:excisionase family DNA binding protein